MTRLLAIRPGIVVLLLVVALITPVPPVLMRSSDLAIVSSCMAGVAIIAFCAPAAIAGYMKPRHEVNTSCCSSSQGS
jgi:hypothetical protein